MKRTILFCTKDDYYSFEENEESIFKINKSKLQLNLKNFYKAFFADGKDYSDIEIISDDDLAKEDKRIFEVVSHLVNDICSRIKEKMPDADQEPSSESIEAYTMPDHKEES